MKVRFRLINRGTADKPDYPNPSMIYARFGSHAIAPTGWRVDPKHWKFPKPVKKGRRPDPAQGLKNSFKPDELSPAQEAKGYKALSEVTLGQLALAIQEAYLKAPKSMGKEDFDNNWLQEQIDHFNGKVKDTDYTYFDNLFEEYLTIKENKSNAEESPHYTRIKEFQGKDRIKVADMNKSFAEEYFRFMIDQGFLPGYSRSELARFRRALRYGLDDLQLNYRVKDWGMEKLMKKYSRKVKPITLTEEELKQLENFECPTESEDNIKRIFLCQCYSALRYSDIFKLNKAKGDSITIIQRKTNNEVVVPILPKVKEILKEKELRYISISYYNIAIKRLCQDAGIDAEVEGRVPKKGKGTEIVTGPKYEFIRSHTGRRTFVTMARNKKFSITEIMNVTGHDTESSLLRYIGEKDNKHVKEFLDRW